MKQEWFKSSYRRNLVDMHIENWNEAFLSKFNPVNYVNMMELAQVQSAMVYANSHVGYCYWPTRTGHMHDGLKGRDVLGEIITLCHQRGMDVIIYYSLIYSNWAYASHPEWRIIDVEGNGSRGPGDVSEATDRYGVCCPNSAYRAFALAQIEELCSLYDFEGVFFDMTFWPKVCYCPACRERYAKEEGRKLPTTIDWQDPNWVTFQKKREEWLSEFAAVTTRAMKKSKPPVTVEHQFSPAVHHWKFGTTIGIAEQSDYTGGDFYGGALQQSFICKLYYNLTGNMPFEFMTTRCLDLNDHTTMKQKEMLETHAYLTLAHGGAFLFIDAVDPVGTLDERGYRLMGEIFEETKKCEPYLGGQMCQDVGIYFNLESKMDLDDSGKGAEHSSYKVPHLDAALGALKALTSNHVPVGVITEKNINKLSEFQVIILPKVLRLDKEEIEALRAYVAGGGGLYVSGSQAGIALGELVGIAGYEGETEERVTYIAPTRQGKTIFPDILPEFPLFISNSQAKVRAGDKREVAATITLPFTNPADGARFVSIHSNPPGVPTDYPAAICRSFGNGKVIWVSTPLEAVNKAPHQKSFMAMVKALAHESFAFEAAAPGCIEVILFQQPEKKRYLINLVNSQAELPNIPVSGAELRVKTEGKKITRLLKLPEELPIPFEHDGKYATIRVPDISTFLMLALDYE